MPPVNNRRQRIPEVFAEDARPGANSHVYCKGCGEPLGGQPRHLAPRGVVATMMCEPCQKRHGHALVPSPGATTYCYRCGERDEIFIEKGLSPVTHHICPRCVPERVARYRKGNFEAVERLPVPEAETTTTTTTT